LCNLSVVCYFFGAGRTRRLHKEHEALYKSEKKIPAVKARDAWREEDHPPADKIKKFQRS
jgi:hypothetical protein